VDLDHPRALDFLREDATHVNAFFRRAGIATLSTRELFEFTVDPHINASNIDAALDRLCSAAASRPAATAAEDQTADNVGLNPPPFPLMKGMGTHMPSYFIFKARDLVYQPADDNILSSSGLKEGVVPFS